MMSLMNPNLISLKCVLFLFFGAVGSLYPFLPAHMRHIRLTDEEAILVSWIAPLVATLGPALACPLADFMATRSKTGKYLRVMIVLSFLFSILFYWLLYAIPIIYRDPLTVKFMCDQNGGFIYQDRCGKDRTCYDFNPEKKGSVLVTNCIYACNESTPFPSQPQPQESRRDRFGDIEEPKYNPGSLLEPDYLNDDAFGGGIQSDQSNYGFETFPHICYLNASGTSVCEVYTKDEKPVKLWMSIDRNTNKNNSQQCTYPFVDQFHCRATKDLIPGLSRREYRKCHPMILCEIENPYDNDDSLLKHSQCGFDNVSFWLYIFLRPIADIFTAAAVALLATAVVIATRDTSTGRGDVGKQFLFGALGFAIFPPIIGALGRGDFVPAMISYTVLLVVACLILLFDNSMPLSPPEWWWHTKCGLLALPMSTVRKYGLEIVALALVLFVLGIFWSSIDAFLPWHVLELERKVNFLGPGENSTIEYLPSILYKGVDDLKKRTNLITGSTITVGSLPAMLYLAFAERFADYCGHSNILIYCFVNYIIHHIALILIKQAKYILICEVLEIFTLHVMYVTAVMYMRHLVLRKYTAFAQALPVIAHFCLGRCFGALVGSIAYYPHENFQTVHKWLAVAAAVVAIFYFFTYHFILKPRCVATAQVPPYPAPLTTNMNGTGSYSPLRVYHHEKAKKGHFRY